jgi:phosphohistidine phosphatase
MALYLVQHGKSMPKEQDPEQGLSIEGAADVERIAEVAGHYGVRVRFIQHSGKKRARQTAEILEAALHPEAGVQMRSGIDPLDEVAVIANDLHIADDLMLVGHLPFMEKLTSYLLIGSVERVLFRFQNGGIVCLDQDPDNHRWFIKWSLMPKIG